MFRQEYRIGTARKMSVDIDATPDLFLLIQQKLCIACMQYRFGSLYDVECILRLNDMIRASE